MNDWELRHRIYQTLAASGGPPSTAEVARWVGGGSAGELALRRLHEAHAIVLDESGEIRMALPFSAVPTEHRVVSGERSWWANCAWDALAVPIALASDAEIHSTWMDTGARVALRVEEGSLQEAHGFVRFKIPARHWWDDIVET